MVGPQKPIERRQEETSSYRPSRLAVSYKHPYWQSLRCSRQSNSVVFRTQLQYHNSREQKDEFGARTRSLIMPDYLRKQSSLHRTQHTLSLTPPKKDVKDSYLSLLLMMSVYCKEKWKKIVQDTSDSQTLSQQSLFLKRLHPPLTK